MTFYIFTSLWKKWLQSCSNLLIVFKVMKWTKISYEEFTKKHRFIKTIHRVTVLVLLSTFSDDAVYSYQVLSNIFYYISQPMTKPTKWHGHPAKTQISLGIHPVQLVFSVGMKKAWVLSYPLSTQQRLIRLGRCPGWSESSLGAHAIL